MGFSLAALGAGALPVKVIHMDLRTFISETLTQIVAGVADAQKHFAAEGLAARLNPTEAERGKNVRTGAPSPVDFDVALTVASESEGSSSSSVGGKAGILNVVSARAGLDDAQKTGEREERISRVKFTVQLGQPADVNEYAPINFSR